MHVLSETRAAVGVLTLNRPEKRNAICAATAAELLAALAALREARARVVILRAAADASVWSAGHDITEFAAGVDPMLPTDPLEQVLSAVRAFPAPVIAMIHGSVWGGAVALALSCDIAVGDETVTFAVTPANLGLPYATTALLSFLRRLPLNVVKELFFTARTMPAAEAQQRGLLNHLTSQDELEPYTFALAEQIAAKAPAMVAATKAQLQALAAASALSAQAAAELEALRRAVYTGRDYAEGLRAFQEGRPPRFLGT